MISERVCTRSLASRLLSGSSMRKSLGSRMMARPRATLWRWPPEKLAGLAVKKRGHVERVRDLANERVDLRLGNTAKAQRIGEIPVHVHVRIERVVLEHHGHVGGPGERHD